MFFDEECSQLFPFVGKWKILQEKREDCGGKSESVVIEKVLSKECVRGDHFLLSLEEKGGSFGPLVLTDENKLEFCPDCKRGSSDQICVSFWRHAYSDVIFSVDVKGDGKLKILWIAEQEHGILPVPENNEVVGKKWEVVSHAGDTAAKNCVKFVAFSRRHRRLFEEDAGGIWKAAVSKFGSQQILSNSLVLESWSKKCNVWIPYDIVIYDDVVKSFNSVFGFRSVFCWNEVSNVGKTYVVATFNSWALRNAPWSSEIYKIYRCIAKSCENRVGNYMNHEDEDEEGDVGLWVAESDG